MARSLFARAARTEAEDVVLERSVLAAAPAALVRLALRRALALCGGRAGLRQVHVERLLGLVRDPAASGRVLALPGGREARVRFGALCIGPRRAAWAAFETPLSVPGRVVLPDGSCLVARASAGGDEGGAVVPLPEGPLVVRTRRPGDRVQTERGERSLKRVLLERRVPADRRGSLPLVAAGGRVVWFPGLPAAAAAPGRGVALAVEPAS